MSNDAITIGSKTTTGGEVISGASGLKINGSMVALVGDTATCKCGSTSCKGQGKIVAMSPRNANVGGVPMARVGDFVDTGCGSCYLVASQHQVSLATNTASSLNIGAGVNIGNGVSINGVSFGGSGAGAAMFQSSVTTATQAQSIATQATSGSSLGSSAIQGTLVTEMTHQFNEVTQDDLREDLKAYLEDKHTQVCILSVEDAAKCTLNIWNQKIQDGERFGSRLLSLLDEIRQYIEIGTGMVAASKLALALGGLGVTTKEFIDADGKGRVIISSLWNDKKKFYAVVNGLNVKKNHPYLITNPTIKQLGVLSKDAIKGFKSGAIITMVVSGVINTEKLIFDSDYYLVDWFGHVGSDLFKAMMVFGVSNLALSIVLGFELAVPVVALALVWVGVDLAISYLWNDEFDIENKIVKELNDAVDIQGN